MRFNRICVFVFSALTAVACPAVAADCEVTRSVPFPNRQFTFYAKTATHTAGQAVLVRGAGPIFVMLSRSGTKMKGKARLVVGRTIGSGTESACDTGWVDVTRQVTFKTPDTNAVPSLWKVEVFDEIDGGPTQDNPYVIEVSISLRRLPGTDQPEVVGSLPSNKPFNVTPPGTPVGECAKVLEPVRPWTSLTVAWSGQVRLARASPPWIQFVTAGRYVHLRITARVRRPITVSLYAKEPGPLPFNHLCDATLVPNSEQHTVLLVGQVNWDRLVNPMWRVDLESTGHDLGSPTSEDLQLSVFRQIDPERFEWNKNISATTWLSTEYVCRATSQRAPAGTVGAPFTRVTSVAITTGGSFPPAALGPVIRTLQSALSIWSANCRSCNYDALALLRINGDLYLRAELAANLATLGQVSINGKPASQTTPAERFYFANKVFASAPDSLSLSQYVRTSAADVPLQRLCSYPDSDMPDSVRRVKSIACNPTGTSQPNRNELRLRLLVPKTTTSCGDSSDIVACEADAELLELNGRDYIYLAPGSQVPVIGDGPTPVELIHVLVHEVGHWLGMPHTDDRTAMMAEALKTSRCINDADIGLLNRAVASDRGESSRPFALFMSGERSKQ